MTYNSSQVIDCFKLSADLVENLVLQRFDFFARNIEVRCRIPVLACTGVVIENRARGVEERTFKAFSGLILAVTGKKNTITHLSSPVFDLRVYLIPEIARSQPFL